MSTYRDQVNRLKKVQVALVIICIIIFAVYLYFVRKPSITGYIVKDECGPIGGTVSHPIDDVDTCMNKCRADCLSYGKEYHRSEFTIKDPDCNLCECFCKDL